MKKRRRIVLYPEKMQISEFERNNPSRAARVKEVPVYEVIAQAMYGGFRKNQHQLCHLGNGDSLTSAPDLLDPARLMAKEIKAIHNKNSFNLDDIQIAKYIILQVGGYFSGNLSFDFEVFRHDVSKMSRLFAAEGLEALIEQLSGNTKFHLSLPFSMVYHLFSSGCEYTGRHESSPSNNLDPTVESWAQKAYTRFQATGLDALLAESEDTIKEIRLNNEDYIVERMRFPSTIKMMGEEKVTPILPFPSIVIRDANPERWPKILKGINFEPFIKILYNQARTDVRSLKLPDHMKIPEDILEELEMYNLTKRHELIVYQEGQREKRGELDYDLFGKLPSSDDDISFDPGELGKDGGSGYIGGGEEGDDSFDPEELE